MKKRLGFIGAGRITRIFLRAFQNKGIHPARIVVSDINPEVSGALRHMFPAVEVSGAGEAAAQDIVFIALHPPVILETLEQVKENIRPGAWVISLAPRVTIEKISARLNNHGNVARMIPNATSYINKGYNPVCFSDNFRDRDELLEMMRGLGETFTVDEPKMEAYAIASAMLPTYFWFQWQEMQYIAMKMGLDEREAKETVEKTLLAALETMYHSGLSYEEVIDLIPVKPIAPHEPTIQGILSDTLGNLFEKIRP